MEKESNPFANKAMLLLCTSENIINHSAFIGWTGSLATFPFGVIVLCGICLKYFLFRVRLFPCFWGNVNQERHFQWWHFLPRMCKSNNSQIKVLNYLFKVTKNSVTNLKHPMFQNCGTTWLNKIRVFCFMWVALKKESSPYRIQQIF